MSSGPRDVGPIEGREVHRDAPPPMPPPMPQPVPAPSAPVPPAPPGSPDRLPVPIHPDGSWSPATAWREVRRNRGRDVPNSRPLPAWVRRFSWVLDDAFPVPGLPGRRVGVDGIVSIVPVAGDAVGVALSLVIVLVGVGAGVSIPTLVRMLLHIGLEALIGVVPFLGTLFNMAYKANNRNVALIERDLADRRATRRSSFAVLLLVVAVLMIGFVMLIALSVAGILVLIWLLSKLF